tara:strand:- start:81 stop:512 length:432 start_codon:yes stop_codon:yes gene_type:complete
MDIIIQKFELPCDMKNVIRSYCYYDSGITVDQMKALQFEKNRRIDFILGYLIRKNNTLLESKPKDVLFNSYYFPDVKYELDCLRTLYKKKLITKAQYVNILFNIYDHMFEGSNMKKLILNHIRESHIKWTIQLINNIPNIIIT